MSNDAEMADRELSSEVARLKAENAELRANADKQKIIDALHEELSKRISAQPAREMAQVLANQCKKVGNEIMVGDAFGPTEIVKNFLNGSGAYLLQTAPIGGRKSEPIESGFDPSKITDPLYGERWKREDPTGYKKAWDKHIASLDNAKMRQAAALRS